MNKDKKIQVQIQLEEILDKYKYYCSEKEKLRKTIDSHDNEILRLFKEYEKLLKKLNK